MLNLLMQSTLLFRKKGPSGPVIPENVKAWIDWTYTNRSDGRGPIILAHESSGGDPDMGELKYFATFTAHQGETEEDFSWAFTNAFNHTRGLQSSKGWVGSFRHVTPPGISSNSFIGVNASHGMPPIPPVIATYANWLLEKYEP